MSIDKKSLDKAVLEIQNLLGKGVIRTYDEKDECTVIPSGFYEFDKASNIGGVPMGKIIEIAGPPSSGKTTLAWQILSNVQRKTGKKILLLDYEQSSSKPYLRKLGVPVEEVFFVCPENAEEGLLSIEDGFEIMKTLLKDGAFCGVIWDSVAASNPKGLLNSVAEKGLEGRDVALTAAALTKGLATYGPLFRKSGATVCFINHKRANLENIANPFLAKFADKEVTPGGTAFKHHADMRIDLKPADFVTRASVSPEGKKIQVKIGQNIKVKFVKNRVGEPFGEEIMTLRSGRGFDIVSSVLKRGIAEGLVIRQSNGKHYLKDNESFSSPSYEGFWNLLVANPQVVTSLQDTLEGLQSNVVSSNFNNTNGRELTIAELAGGDSVEEVSMEEKAYNPDETEEKVTVLDNVLDALMDQQANEEAKGMLSTPVNLDDVLLASEPIVTPKKRGRPAKVKVS